MIQPYRVIVGLEVHVELSTATKMFCRCPNRPDDAPNMNVCPVCLGLPGALPTANREAVLRTLRTGTAIGSRLAPLSKWDRKHYFYPDLPKGYQISQYDLPLCTGGSLQVPEGGVVRFARIHLEEDAGKLHHEGAFSLVDLNRAGVPLMELVTEPDLTSGAEARRFLQELRLLVRAIGVSEADMEKGQLRCDVNVNVSFTVDALEVRTPITEVKNVNSSKAVQQAVEAEARRQYDEWMSEGPIRGRREKITVGWDEDAGRVNLQRAKEGEAEYRYFPEPDLPPVVLADLPPPAPLPELPGRIRQRLTGGGVGPAEAELLLSEPALLAAYDAAVPPLTGKRAAAWIINVPGAAALPAEALIGTEELVAGGSVAFSAMKDRFADYAARLASETPEQAATALHLISIHDAVAVEAAIGEVFSVEHAAVREYRAGNQRVLGFLIGKVMKLVGADGQPAKVQVAVKKALAG